VSAAGAKVLDNGTFGIIFATFAGPIAAVLVTRGVDNLRDKERRRLEVFRSLMRTRRMPLSQEHVSALNLVEIEFISKPKVIAAFKALLSHYDSGYGANKTLDELKAANDKADALRTTLLSAIAVVLGYNFEQMDILRGSYMPQGWGVELDEQTAVRKGLAELLSGRRPLPIYVAQSPPTATPTDNNEPASPFPPKPN
jgi:hypothetical protein